VWAEQEVVAEAEPTPEIPATEAETPAAEPVS